MVPWETGPWGVLCHTPGELTGLLHVVLIRQDMFLLQSAPDSHVHCESITNDSISLKL